jgi:SAM-dependent methyltransferase
MSILENGCARRLGAVDELARAHYDGRMSTRVPSEDEPHRHRQVAESFGTDAELYDRTRPHYPDALVQRIVASSPGIDVLDVGIGTGKEARQFRAAGCKVLGVEPDARMADFARRYGLEVEVATFEDWDPAGRDFDVVVAGQSWHWVDPLAGAVKASRVLRPEGLLAAFWNVAQPPPEVSEAFVTVYQRAVPDSPFDLSSMPKQAMDGYRTLFARTSGGIRESGAFGYPEQWRFDWERYYAREEWLDQLPTQGTLTWLPSDRVAEVLEGVGAAVDAMGGGFTMSYTTVAIIASRTDAA